MATRFIIMADGKGKRWDGEVPKHLIEIGGETLIERTVRLLGDEDIYITSHNPWYEVPPAKRYEPKNNVQEIDRFHACSEIWCNMEDVCFLYGDVYYTPRAIELIKSGVGLNGIAFYGRIGGNGVKKYGEMFALRVKGARMISEFGFNIALIRNKELKGEVRGLGWDVYRAFGKKNFIRLPEICEDFDKVEDLEKWKQKHDIS